MIETVIGIAHNAGKLLRDHFGLQQKVNHEEQRDIKLQIDLDTQQLIDASLMAAFPTYSILGEEACQGDPNSEYRWVVDPLDGTVNYTYGIPHVAVSIALQKKNPASKHASVFDGYESILGVIHDPLRAETFYAEKGRGAHLNGQPIQVSKRSQLPESIISIGFARSEETIRRGLENYQRLLRQVRKIRTMGSAALDLAYVASGRFDAYFEFQVRLWDIAAGTILIEEAGGRIDLELVEGGAHTYKTHAFNGKVELGIA